MNNAETEGFWFINEPEVKLKKANTTQIELKFQCVKGIVKSRKFMDVSRANFNCTPLQETYIS